MRLLCGLSLCVLGVAAILECVSAAPDGIDERFRTSVTIADKGWKKTSLAQAKRQAMQLARSGFSRRSDVIKYTNRRGVKLLKRTYSYSATTSAEKILRDVTALRKKFPTIFTKAVVAEFQQLAKRYEAGERRVKDVLDQKPVFSITFSLTVPQVRRNKRWLSTVAGWIRTGVSVYNKGKKIYDKGKKIYDAGKTLYNAGKTVYKAVTSRRRRRRRRRRRWWGKK